MNFDKLKKCLEENKIDINSFANKKEIKIESLIREGKNDLREIEEFKESGGIYIFKKADKIVYIGKAGRSHGLKDRIQKQLNCNPSNANLAKNINEKENCNCDEKIENKTIFDINYLKKYLKSNTDTLIIIPIKEDDRTISLLETILIYQYNPIYNKD